MEETTRIKDFFKFQNISDEQLDHIEKIIRVHRFDRKRGNLAKSHIRRATQILTREGSFDHRISDEDLARVINWVLDIARRGREKVYLEISPDLEGIREVTSGDEIRFQKAN